MEYFPMLNEEKMCPLRPDICFLHMSVYKTWHVDLMVHLCFTTCAYLHETKLHIGTKQN